jgi:RNA polymerase sigma factor (sigma-70 family)
MAIRIDEVDLQRDRDLVQRYQAGDPGAFDDLYRRYFDRLHGYCARRVGDRHTAEELAQEAFLRALRAMPRFAGERRFYPWMTVIAQRLCIDHHRRNGRVEVSDDVDPGSVEPDHDLLFRQVDHAHLATASIPWRRSATSLTRPPERSGRSSEEPADAATPLPRTRARRARHGRPLRLRLGSDGLRRQEARHRRLRLTARRSAALAQRTPSRSTTNTRVSSGPMTPPAPRLP